MALFIRVRIGNLLTRITGKHRCIYLCQNLDQYDEPDEKALWNIGIFQGVVVVLPLLGYLIWKAVVFFDYLRNVYDLQDGQLISALVVYFGALVLGGLLLCNLLTSRWDGSEDDWFIW